MAGSDMLVSGRQPELGFKICLQGGWPGYRLQLCLSLGLGVCLSFPVIRMKALLSRYNNEDIHNRV